MSISVQCPLYCSTGTMIGRVNQYRWQLIIEHMPALIEASLIDGAELMMLPVYYDQMDIMGKELRQSGIPFPTIHCEKEIGALISQHNNEDTQQALALFRLNCEMGQRVGASRMILHLWGGLSSDSHIEYNLSLLETLLEIIRPYHLQLLIENIPCTTYSPLENWRKLYAYVPQIGFVFDTRFGQLHRQIPQILEEDFLWQKNNTGSAPISHMHISDFNGAYKEFSALRPILHPRDGHIDFPMIARGLKKRTYTGSITLESPVMSENGLDLTKLQQSLRYLHQLLEQPLC